MSSSQQNTVKTMEGAVGVRDLITLALLLIFGMVLMSYLVSSLLTRCKPLGEHLTASLFGKSTEETSGSVATDGKAPLRYDRQRGWVAVAGMPYDNVYDSAAHRGNVIMRGMLHKKTDRSGISKFVSGNQWIPRQCVLHEGGLFLIKNTRGSTKVQFSVMDITCQVLQRKEGQLTILSITSNNDRANFIELGALKEDQADEWLRCVQLIQNDPAGIP